SFGGGKLDLDDGALIIDYDKQSPLGGPKDPESVAGHLASGYADGKWDGLGISSSAAARSALADALVAGEAADLLPARTFFDKPVDATAVVVGYTLVGDAN